MIISEKNWKKWNIQREHHQFFVLTWEEIFNRRTFHSWQVRTSNIRSILNEITEAIQVVRKNHIYHHNIKALLDEALEIIDSDLIIKKYYPFVRDYLKKAETIYENKVKNDKKQEVNHLERVLKVISGNITGYIEKLFDEILNIVKDEKTKNYKIHLSSLMMSLGIELKCSGYSTQFLINSKNILLQNTELPFEQRVQELKSQLSCKNKKYKCFFYISWSGDFINLKNNQIIQENRPDRPLSTKEENFYSKDPKAKIVSITVEALDPYSAKNKCEQLLKSLFTVKRFYQASKRPIIKHSGSLIYNEDDKLYKYLSQERDSNDHLVPDANNPNLKIKEFTDLQSLQKRSDYMHLSAALQYHSLALDAPSNETKLINLWIALESLVQHGEESIIQKICTYISTSHTTSYIHSMLLALSYQIKQIWKSSVATEKNELLTILKNSSKFSVKPFDLLMILTDKFKGDMIMNLLKITSTNSLSVFKIYQLWDKIFKSPEILYKRLEAHNQHIEWQLKRIYRVRNNIMHMGFYKFDIRHIIEHLHNYLIVAIHNIIRDLKEKPDWTIAESFEHRFLGYNRLLDQLKNHSKDNPVSLQTILDPARIILKEAPLPAWPNIN